MKRCGRCGIEKVFEEFTKDRKRLDGFYPVCKACQKSYRDAHKQELQQRDKSYRETHKELIRQQKSDARKRDPEKTRQQHREERLRNQTTYQAYRETHSKQIREQTRLRYAKNRETLCLKSRLYAKEHPEKVKEQRRRWQKAHVEQIRAYRKANRHHDRAYYEENRDRIREKVEAKRQWCTYRIFFPDGCFYIGSSCHFDLRFNFHKSAARRGAPFSALNRSFDGAQVTVENTCGSEAAALEKESVLIAAALSDEKCLNKSIPKPPSKLYWVYVIQSLQQRQGDKPGFFYVGMTNDPAHRLRAHNGEIKGGGRYTSKFRPWAAKALHGPYFSRSDALRAEFALKRQKRGEGRLRWTTLDSPYCCGEGVNHPWVKDPVGWSPPSLEEWQQRSIVQQ